MEKLKIFSFLFFLSSQVVWAQSLEIIKTQKFEGTERYNSHRYGGISGLSFSDGFLWAVTDDRGQFGSPRMYKHSLKNNSVKIESEISIKEPKGTPVVDYEAIYRFKDGKFLISSEGDFNKKPRVFPFIKFWTATDKWKNELLIPEQFFPEKTGMQTKGLQNNSAFEAMTVSPDELSVYLMSEVALYQNQKSEIEFLEYEATGNEWKFKSRKAYIRDVAPEGAFEVMRGISDILYWKKDSLLVLERTVRVGKGRAVTLGAELFSVNIQDLKKKKLFTFDKELAANWEGLTWGPDLSDGRKLLILVSDNNFERATPTQYLFLAFKEEKP